MEEWIGILGCGGSVGRHATEKLLKAGYWILGGREENLTVSANMKSSVSFRSMWRIGTVCVLFADAVVWLSIV